MQGYHQALARQVIALRAQHKVEEEPKVQVASQATMCLTGTVMQGHFLMVAMGCKTLLQLYTLGAVVRLDVVGMLTLELGAREEEEGPVITEEVAERPAAVRFKVRVEVGAATRAHL